MRQSCRIFRYARWSSPAALVLLGLATLAAPVAAQPAGDGGGTLDRAELKQLGDELTKQYAALERSRRELPRDRFDPQAVIERVGRDPAALANWVRDETDLLPYRGALRGATGVLMDRGGNSLDRSLLLAELLRAVGQNVRLANGTLAPERVAQLAKQASSRRHAPAATGTDVPPALADARGRVQRHADQLLKALGEAKDAPQAGGATEALADHWWVQRQDGGAWVDVDVTAADAKAAQPAARTVDLAANSADRLPLDAKDCHEVELTVVVEFWREGGLKTERVLGQTFRAAESLGRDVMFTHFGGAALRDAELYKRDEPSRKRLAAAMAAQKSWMPVLRVGGRSVTDASFTTSGEIEKNPKVDPRGQLGGAAGRTLGGFGGGLTGGGDSVADADVLTAEWIEYVIRVPGQEPQTVRREVFDLVGPAARTVGVATAPSFTDDQKLRRAALLLGRNDILIQPCDFGVEFVDDQIARRALADRKVWLTLTAGEFKTAGDALKILDRASGASGNAPLSVALGRVGLLPQRGGTFIDRPNILQSTTWAEPHADGRELKLRERFDLAFTSTASDGFATRVTQGVADTLAEQLALGGSVNHGNTGPENTVELFAAVGGKAPVVVRDAGSLPAEVSPDAKARAAADLAAGNVLVLAQSDGGRCGWWRVDPRTGQTVGVMDSGFHQGTTEYDVLQAEVDSLTLGVPWRVSAQEYAKMGAREVMQLAGRNTLTHQQWLQVVNLQQRILTCLNRPFTMYIF